MRTVTISTYAHRSIFPVLLPMLMLALLPAAPAWAQVEQKLLSPGANPDIPISDGFGLAVDVSGHRLLVGGGTKSYIFEPDQEGNWTDVAELEGGFLAWSRSISLDGDRAITGYLFYPSSQEAKGAAFIYDRQDGGAWTKSATLAAEDGAVGDLMGLAVSLDGDRALVGAPGSDEATGGGAAYILERQEDGSWEQVAKLTPDDANARVQFGLHVSLDGGRALVGCGTIIGEAGEFLNPCVPYVFERQQNGSWMQTARLVSDAAAEDNQHVSSMALQGGRAVVSLFLPVNPIAQVRGHTYIFERQGDGSWQQVQELPAVNGVTYAGPAALDGDRVLLGTFGGAFLFERQGNGSWQWTGKLEPSAEGPYNAFGTSVALDGGVAAVGTALGFNPGAAFVYTGMTSTPVEVGGLPGTLALSQNYPNPFSPATTIPFTLVEPGIVRLAVYDVLGREVAVLVDGMMGPGMHQAGFNAANLPNGIYLYRLEAGTSTEVRRMVLVR